MLNFPILALAAIVPLLVGFIWYHPKVFGTAWMQAAGVTPEQGKDVNMLKVFGLTFILSLMLAMVLQVMVVHQFSLYSVVADTVKPGDTTSPDGIWLKNALDTYGTKFRTFKHGTFHGFIAGLFLFLPIVGVNALFERKSAKYIFINTGFWTVCAMIMGGIICQFV